MNTKNQTPNAAPTNAGSDTVSKPNAIVTDTRRVDIDGDSYKVLEIDAGAMTDLIELTEEAASSVMRSVIEWFNDDDAYAFSVGIVEEIVDEEWFVIAKYVRRTLKAYNAKRALPAVAAAVCELLRQRALSYWFACEDGQLTVNSNASPLTEQDVTMLCARLARAIGEAI
jgi:hypothetical protein